MIDRTNYAAMRQAALENIRKSMEQLEYTEYFTIQLYKGDRMYTVGTSYGAKSEAALTMIEWADIINADHGHIVSDLTGEVIISF